MLTNTPVLINPTPLAQDPSGPGRVNWVNRDIDVQPIVSDPNSLLSLYVAAEANRIVPLTTGNLAKNALTLTDYERFPDDVKRGFVKTTSLAQPAAQTLNEALPGVTIGLSSQVSNRLVTVDDLLEIETGEFPDIYQMRVTLTQRIQALQQFNPVTCVVLGSMMINKMRYALTYDEGLEQIMTQVLLRI